MSNHDRRNGSKTGQLGRSLARLDRRRFLGGLSGATVLGGLGLLSSGTVSASPPGSGWTLDFEDDFEGGSLDTDTWDYGWGWGDNANYTPATSNSSGVWVEDSVLKQRVWRDGGQHYVGNVHSQDRVEFSPPVYFEARIRCHDLPGANNAFWAKPASEAWPPEIDVMEVHRDSSSEVMDHSIHNLHYSNDGGTGGGHGEISNATNTLDSGDYQDDFHTFGVLWREDEIAHYLDGNRIGRSTHSTMLSSMNSGAPFYMMLSMQTIGNEGWLGDVPDESWDNYDTVMETDWVRVWKPDESDDGNGGDEEHFLWPRSADGGEVTFAFEVSGDVRLQDLDADEDYWVAADRSVAGGTTSNDGTYIPGFYYTGDIVDLRYSGPLDLYIDDQPADPDSYVDPDSPGPFEHRLLEISRAPSSSGRVDYVIETDGTVQDGSDRGQGRVAGGDRIYGSTASGAVWGGTDPYILEDVSTIEVATAGGGVLADVDGQTLDLSEPTSL